MVELLSYVIWILFLAALLFFVFHAWDKKQQRLTQEEIARVRREYERNYPGPPHCKGCPPANRMDEYLPTQHGVGGADAARCNQETGGRNAH